MNDSLRSGLESAKIENCIYGQMTGSCQSRRSKELMDASCIRVLKENVLSGDGIEFKTLKTAINGEYTGQDWYSEGRRSLDYLSSLEGYINLRDAKNAQIIQYIKDEINTLKL